MRRLRDRLIAAIAPLILILLGAVWVEQNRVLDDLSDTLTQRITRSQSDLRSVYAKISRRLRDQALQIHQVPAMQDALTTYLEAILQVHASARAPANATQREELASNLETARYSLLKDVGPNQVHNAGLDLMVMVDLQGQLLASIRAPGDESFEVTDHTAEDAAARPADEPLIKKALEEARQMREGDLRNVGKRFAYPPSFTLYADRKLYCIAVQPLMRGKNVEGVVAVGTRDFRPSTGESFVAYTVSGRVVDSRAPGEDGHEKPNTMAPEALADFQTFLATWQPPSPQSDATTAQPPVTPIALAGQPFLGQPSALPSFGRVAPLGWTFVMLPSDALLKPGVQAQRQLLRVGAGVLVVAVILVAVLSSRITRPIEDLSQKMQRVGAGHLDVQAEVKGRDEVAALASAFNTMVDGLREKQRLAAYVPEKAREAIADAKGREALGAKRVKACVLFSDLRGFTTLSENLDPTAVVVLLNEYLERMQQVISRHGGYISDYIGDAIVAVFTDDDRGDGCALRGARCAADMQDALAELRRTSRNTHLQTVHMGIGLNTGELVEGDMGPAARLKYAVVGDTVNTAARIQDRSKEGRHTCILISQSTCDEVRGEFEVVFFGEEMLKGKSTSVAIWEISGRHVPDQTVAS